MNRIFYILTAAVLLAYHGAFAQLPPNQPEQDCPNAIPVCVDQVFTQLASYQGGTNNNGLIPNEITPGNSCLGTGEKNAVWYTFNVNSSGLFGFNITPVILGDDYDWAVYNLTNATCADIATATNPTLEVSCNYSGTPGITGANGMAGGQNEPTFPVVAGQTYVLVVSNYENNPNSNNGYTIDFSPPPSIPTGQTATIGGDSTDALYSVPDTVVCGTTFRMSFSESVTCSQVNNQSFRAEDMQGNVIPISTVASLNCGSGRSSQFDLTLGNYPLGTINLILLDSVEDACGNIAKFDTAQFEIIPRDLFVSPASLLLCDNATANLSYSITPALSNDQIQWVTPDTVYTNTNSIFIAPTVYSEYILTVTNPKGCVNIDTVKVDVLETPQGQIDVPSDTTICFGDSIQLTSSVDDPTDIEYYWTANNSNGSSFSDLTSPNPYFTPNQPNEEYSLQLQVGRNAMGRLCFSFSNEVKIYSGSDLQPKFSVDTTEGEVPFTPIITNESTGSEDYSWLLSNLASPELSEEISTERNPKLTLNDDGTYSLTLLLTDQYGCEADSSITLTATGLLIPNVITPNNDGKNDLFVIRGVSAPNVKIFNRWGKEVYVSENYANDWGGEDVSSGTYFYEITNSKTTAVYKGWLQIIK